DPYDTFNEMGRIHSERGLKPIMFFLTSGYGKYDKSISPQNETFRELVGQTMKFGSPAIHPSYRSAGKPAILQKEIQTLSYIAGVDILDSRQHYLKFNLPESYRQYLEAGIRKEYSMGFASHCGFRAGTSKPFHFYDLEKETETPLKVTPFQVMDRTLKDYMKLSPLSAVEKIRKLIDAVRSVNGTFVSIWHNDAFSDKGEWEGWKVVYLEMLNYIQETGD
ncbi:MAG: polysaccharide deacetylase family protein, partial [Bacteroidales bacterium]|nr:polysaccharide deacetylase family protein [Bacteroidales bacterium]